MVFNIHWLLKLVLVAKVDCEGMKEPALCNGRCKWENSECVVDGKKLGKAFFFEGLAALAALAMPRGICSIDYYRLLVGVNQFYHWHLVILIIYSNYFNFRSPRTS